MIMLIDKNYGMYPTCITWFVTASEYFTAAGTKAVKCTVLPAAAAAVNGEVYDDQID